MTGALIQETLLPLRSYELPPALAGGRANKIVGFSRKLVRLKPNQVLPCYPRLKPGAVHS